MSVVARQNWVVKIGSSLLTDHGRGLDTAALADWARQIALLEKQGVNVVLVSSGAVAEGMLRLGWSERPQAIHDLQAVAAIGQVGLVHAWEEQFRTHGIKTAQILLTHDDLQNRHRYLNARSTLRALIDLGVVPVVNENDTVVTDEIRFGDNDTLAALVTNLIEADRLVILTDQEGLFDSNPATNAGARLISRGQAGDPDLLEMAQGTAGKLGRGGMLTKVQAAERAARSGAVTVIANGKRPDLLIKLLDDDEGLAGTWLRPSAEPLTARKQWLAGHLQVRGQIKLDAGAVDVLENQGRSLLAVGVTEVLGQFERGEAVQCLDVQGRVIAHGLVNYSSDEAQKIAGRATSEIESVLGYLLDEELIHRDNLVLV